MIHAHAQPPGLPAPVLGGLAELQCVFRRVLSAAREFGGAERTGGVLSAGARKQRRARTLPASWNRGADPGVLGLAPLAILRVQRRQHEPRGGLELLVAGLLQQALTTVSREMALCM